MNAKEMCQHLAASGEVEYDCRRCGACCLSTVPAPGYVLLEPEEGERLSVLGLPLVSSAGELRLGTQAYDGPGGRAACAAFEGAPGFPGGCHVYGDRPLRCQQFEMGSTACRLARLRAGLPV